MHRSPFLLLGVLHPRSISPRRKWTSRCIRSPRHLPSQRQPTFPCLYLDHILSPNTLIYPYPLPLTRSLDPRHQSRLSNESRPLIWKVLHASGVLRALTTLLLHLDP